MLVISNLSGRPRHSLSTLSISFRFTSNDPREHRAKLRIRHERLLVSMYLGRGAVIVGRVISRRRALEVGSIQVQYVAVLELLDNVDQLYGDGLDSPEPSRLIACAAPYRALHALKPIRDNAYGKVQVDHMPLPLPVPRGVAFLDMSLRRPAQLLYPILHPVERHLQDNMNCLLRPVAPERHSD